MALHGAPVGDRYFGKDAVAALLHAGIGLVAAPQSLVWWAVVVGLMPSLAFFMRLFLVPTARTAEIVWPTLLAPLTEA